MKTLKNALVLAASLLIFSQPSLAEEQTLLVKKKTMEVSTNGVSLIFGGLGLSYYLGLNNTVALGVHGNGVFFSIADSLSIIGGGGGLSAKFFLSSDAFTSGWYVEPNLSTSYTSLRVDNKFIKGWNITPSVTGGYNWIWSKGFSLTLGLGARYNHMFADQNLTRSSLSWSMKGFTPTGNFSLGWAW